MKRGLDALFSRLTASTWALAEMEGLKTRDRAAYFSGCFESLASDPKSGSLIRFHRTEYHGKSTSQGGMNVLISVSSVVDKGRILSSTITVVKADSVVRPGKESRDVLHLGGRRSSRILILVKG